MTRAMGVGSFAGDLHSHSYFSFLDGVSSPDALAGQAATLGYQALALTDHDSLGGLVAHAQACGNAGITPIAGAELTLDDGSHVTLLARDAAGYRSLCRAVSLGQLAGTKGAPRATLEHLALCGVGVECLTGCRRGRVQAALLRGDGEGALAALDALCAIFGAAHVWIEVQLPGLRDDRRLAYLQAKLARARGVGLVATGNTHYATAADRDLQDIVTCITHNVPLSRALPHVRQGTPWRLCSPAEMDARFAALPLALWGTRELTERCRFDLSSIDARLPDPPTLPPGVSAPDHLRALVRQGAWRRYGDAVQSDALRRRLDHELSVITTLGLAGYFLIVRDIVRYAEEGAILCQARGSAVGSCVCYCLGISSVEPLAHRLSFERFLSPGRTDPPDIDLDFPSERDGGRPGREQVIQHVLRSYQGHAALIATLITYQPRSAIRDIGMALGLGQDQIATLAKEQEHGAGRDAGFRRPPGMPEGAVIDRLFSLCGRLEGIPRHYSQHPGGIVLTRRPLAEVAPIERARMPQRVIVQWDKEAAEAAGLMKTDHLGLGMLAAIDEAFAMVEEATGERPQLQGFRCDDPAVYDMFCRSDTVGVFQLESRAQMQQCLPRLQPRTLDDLAAAVALIRPGPIQGNATTPYLRRRQGRERVAYPGGEAGRRLLDPVLGDTYGVILYQDSVIDIAIAAGMSSAEAADLRRAMGSKRSKARMEALTARLDVLLAAHGLNDAGRSEVIAMMTSFSSYGFVRGHSQAFGYLAYISCWLKHYYPAPFAAALLNSLPMGFYPPDYLIQDAGRHGVRLLPLDVRASRARWTVEEGALRVGLRTVHGLGTAACARIADVMHGEEPARTPGDLYARAGLSEREATALAASGALRGLEPDRRRALWRAPTTARAAGPTRLPGWAEESVQDAVLPALTDAEAFALDDQVLGFSPEHHVLALLRPDLAPRPLQTSETITRVPRGRRVEAAGQVIARQRPGTAQGTVFLSLSDEWGVINAVVTPAVYEVYRSVLRGETLLWLEGTIDRRHGVTSLQVMVARSLTALITRATREAEKTTDRQAPSSVEASWGEPLWPSEAAPAHDAQRRR